MLPPQGYFDPLAALRGDTIVYHGTVTSVTDATHCIIDLNRSDLTIRDDDYFINWYIYVVRDAGGAGAAPQGESQPISDYASSTNIFTHTVFTATLAEDDEVLIVHPDVANVAEIDAIWDELLAGHTTAGSSGKTVSDILADTIMIADGALPASPVLNSIARFVASGGTALGTPLADSKSLVDAVGHTGAGLLTSGIGAELRRGTGTQIPNDKGIYDYLLYLTGDSYVRLGAPAGASVSADIANIFAEVNAAALAQGAGSVASNAQVDSLVRAITDIVRAGGTGDLASVLSYVDCLPVALGDLVTKNLAHILSDSTAFAGADIAAIKAKSDLMNSASGTGTLNDANTSDTIVPTSLPTKIHLIFDISNLNNNLDDFTIQVSVGVAASERVVAYYNLTSDGTDITVDTGSGVGTVIKVRRIDISNILCFTGEQVIVQLTKNGATDRNVLYEYVCGM